MQSLDVIFLVLPIHKNVCIFTVPLQQLCSAWSGSTLFSSWILNAPINSGNEVVEPFESSYLFTMRPLPDAENLIFRKSAQFEGVGNPDDHTYFNRVFYFSVALCRPFNYLCKTPELVTVLQGLSEDYDISPLLRYLLPHFVSTVMRSDTGKLA